MHKNVSLIAAAIIFSVVALMHLLRLYFKLEIMIDHFVIPMWTSIVAFIVAITLSIWMYISSR